MKHKKKFYITLGIIIIVSILTAWIMPITEKYKDVFLVPVIIALIAGIFQILRDQYTFEKEEHFDLRKRIFEIGATSHMANTAFDKHVEFCEKYMREVHNTVSTLFTEGPTIKAIGHAKISFELRCEYAAWLTDEINLNLEPYEQALRSVGIWTGFAEQTHGDIKTAETRSQKIEDTYKKFDILMGQEADEDLEGDEDAKKRYAIESIKKKIREILGIEELTKIRKYLIKEAINAIDIDS